MRDKKKGRSGRERERERETERGYRCGRKRVREISMCKYKEYKKAKSFIWMF